jgi:FAD synthase
MVFLAEGDDFRCGHLGACNIGEISRLAGDLGFTLEVQNSVIYQGERVSSSRIRDAVKRGDVTAAGEMLGRPYSLDCASWAWRPEEGGLRAEVGRAEQALPESGVFPVLARIGGIGGKKEIPCCFGVSGGEAALSLSDKTGDTVLEIIFVR